MFHDKTELGQKIRNNIVTTKEINIWYMNRLILRNKKYIVNKKQNGN